MPVSQRTVEVVEWTDASLDEGPVNAERLSPLKRLLTTGFVVRENESLLSVAHEWCPEDRDYRNVSHIPKVNIIRRQRFRVKG